MVGTVISAVGVVAVYGCVAGFLSTVLLLWVRESPATPASPVVSTTSRM
jgi:hypothetical protein